jgi:lysophospholipase L1-like esterase
MAADDFPAGGYVGDLVGFGVAWALVVGGTVVYFRRTRGRPGRGRLVVGNLLVLACLLSTAALAAETYLRYVYDATDSWGLMLTHRSWMKRHFDYNSAGFRDREWVERPPSVVTVSCVGDSFTQGWGVPDVEDCWPQRVGAALEKLSPGRFDVHNVGRSGWNTSHEVAAMNVIATRGHARQVVLAYCLNDADDLLPPDRWFGREQAPQIPLVRPTMSFLADFLWFRLKLRADPRVTGYFEGAGEAYEDPRLWARQCAQFQEIAETCRAASIRLDVFVFPFFHAWGPQYRFDALHDKVLEGWRRVGIEAIDLREAYRGIPGEELVAGRYDAHPNARAHEIAAKVVLERVFGAK